MRGQSIEINVLLSATSGTLNRTVQRQKYTDQLLFRKLMASGGVCKHLEINNILHCDVLWQDNKSYLHAFSFHKSIHKNVPL